MRCIFLDGRIEDRMYALPVGIGTVIRFAALEGKWRQHNPHMVELFYDAERSQNDRMPVFVERERLK